jgi:hypothetical protein
MYDISQLVDRRVVRLGAPIVLSILSISVNTWAGTFEVLHSFGVAANDGNTVYSS